MTERFNRKDREAVLHYVTINVRDKIQPFAHDAYARIFLQALQEHCAQHPAKLIAYGVMPEHAHLIINPKDGSCTRFLKHFKADVTNRIAAYAQRHGVQSVLAWLQKEEGNCLWQEGKHSFHLYSEGLIWQKINYIHNNPIRRGLVKQAHEYPYSSFRAMYEGYGEPIIPIDRDFWWSE